MVRQVLATFQVGVQDRSLEGGWNSLLVSEPLILGVVPPGPFHCRSGIQLAVPVVAPPAVLKKIEGFVEGMRSNDRDLRSRGSAVHSARSDLCKWIHADGGSKYLRPLNADERDLALGFPAGTSRLPAGHPKDKLGEEYGRCLFSGIVRFHWTTLYSG